MSDLFENRNQQNFFQPQLPESPDNYGPNTQVTLPRGFNDPPGQPRGKSAANLFNQWSEGAQKLQDFRDELQLRHGGQSLSMRESNFLYDMKTNDSLNEDEIYKYMSARELAEYFQIDPNIVYNNFDEIWKLISDDREDRYAPPKTLYEATKNSVQIAWNMLPMGKMGIELQSLDNGIAAAKDEAKRKDLQQKRDKLFEEIMKIRQANDELARRMPDDALTTIITGTIQSAPLTLKSMGGGAVGGLVAGGAGALMAGPVGFAAGWKGGYKLGSFAASSAEMTGLLYIDLIAAGVEQENASRLALVGGSINGFIESGLGVVAGWGKSAAKTIGGAVLSKEAQAKIAEAASKSFIKKILTDIASSAVGRSVIAKTLLETAKQAGEEGIEEALQFLVEQAMVSIGDALQDSPVDRNLWGSPEFWDELGRSVVGGIAGGIGFGVINFPFTFAGNVRETAALTKQLKNLAVTIDDKAEFIPAARENPLAKNLTDEQLGQMYDKSEGERLDYHKRMREEAEKAGGRYAAMPTIEAPANMRRKGDGRLDIKITADENEDGSGEGSLSVYDPPTGQMMAGLDYSWDAETNTITVENIEMSRAIADGEGVIADMFKELAWDNPEMEFVFEPDERMSEAAGVDLAALKKRLIEANPRGAENGLKYFRSGDEFNMTRENHKDIATIARFTGWSMEAARDNWRVMNTARNFGRDVHEMISGLTNEEELRLRAAEDPQGVNAQILRRLDEGRIAAQQSGQRIGGGIVAIKRGVNGEPDQILNNINDAMKENFERLRAITVVTQNSDPATLLHEWMHWMTSFVIPNSPRYKTLLEEAVSKAFGKEIKLEDFNREHHEWLSKNFEHYMKTGEAPTPGLKALFRRIAEALRELFSQWTGNPELKKYFDELLAGPQSAAGQEAETKSAARVQTDNGQQKAFAEMTEAQRVFQSDLYTDSEKMEMLHSMREARNAIESAQMTKEAAEERKAATEAARGQWKANKKVYGEDQKHKPTAALIDRAMNIADEAEREKAVKNIRELRKAYEGADAEYKAPNGKDSLLLDALGQEKGKEAWYAVRTQGFKDWFGDWEALANSYIENDVNSINEAAALVKNLVNEKLENKLLKINGTISENSLRKLTKDDSAIKKSVSPKLHALAVANIKKLFENAAIDVTHKDTKGNRDVELVHRVGALMTYQGEHYPVKITLKQYFDSKKGTRLYSVEALTVEKIKSAGQLADAGKTGSQAPIADFNKKIIQLAESVKSVSKIVDENGEPQTVFHGTHSLFDIFDRNKGSLNDAGWSGEGHYFYEDFNEAAQYAQGNDGHIMAEFLNVQEPYYLSDEERNQLVEQDSRDFSIEFTEQLKSDGYDGVFYNGDLRKEWTVFNPNQIKSATDNAGTFSSDDDSILFQTAWNGSTAMFDRFDNYYASRSSLTKTHGWGHSFYSQREAADWFSKKLEEYKGAAGWLYEAKIPDDTELLEWEKSLNSQPEKVKNAAVELITWNKDGKSNFNEAYNLRKFKDGNYGFFRSINGKMKWATIEEAQTAAKSEIMKTLNGQDFYAGIAKIIGEKNTSLLLDSMGVKGIKYFDKTTEKMGLSASHSFTVFGDQAISMTPLLFQTAYHGSPYKFAGFDSSHMGKGEGAQAFGYGHYFAGKKEIAEHYRKSLAETKYYDGDRELYGDEAWAAQFLFNNETDNPSKITKQEAVEKAKKFLNQEGQERIIPLINKLDNDNLRYEEGQLYEVDIPDDDEMLDWDKKLSEQPEQVREIIKRYEDKIKIPGSVIDNMTGERIYRQLSQKKAREKRPGEIFEGGNEKDDKAASEYLGSIGIKGIRYLDGSSCAAGEGSHNYVIFDDNDIKITKTFYEMLFQMTREEIYAEALNHSSPQKWMEADDFAEAVSYDDGLAAYHRDNKNEEPVTKAEKEAWYEKQWNEAQVLAREAALGDDGERMPANAESVNPQLLGEENGSLDWDTELYDREAEAGQKDTGGAEAGSEEAVTPDNEKKPITTSEANRRLVSRLPKVIDDFLLLMGQTLRENLAHFGAVTEEDAAAREQIERDKERIYKEAHQYVRALALRTTTGKQLTETQRRTAMSHIRRSLESGATVYRELYASLSGDKEFIRYAENETQDTGVKGEAQRAAREAQGLTAFQRTRLAERITDKDIARKIRKGKATQEELENYVKRGEEELREMDKEIKSLEGELEKSKGETEQERAEAEAWYRQYRKTKAELETAVKEADNLQEKLEEAREAKVNAAERMRESRLKSEADLKEKLASKRDEIKALRRKLKEDTAHAEKQGRLTKAWQWAEWRKKLDDKEAQREKKAADKKAAAKALANNKKLTAWIFSPNRIGMNVWVRQRELIMGILNALFDTSEKAAWALKLDAEIKDITRKIEKEKRRLAKAENEDATNSPIYRKAGHKKEESQYLIDQYENQLDILKSERAHIEIISPDLSGVNTDQAGPGKDTYDAGTIVYNGKTMSVEEFRQQFYEGQIRYGFMDSKLRKTLYKSAPPAFKDELSAKSAGEKRKTSAAILAKTMSEEDLLAVKTVIEQLNKEGKANWHRRQFAVHLEQQELIKAILFGQDELVEEGKTGQAKRFKKAMETGNMAEREKILGKGADIERKAFMTLDDKRLTQWMDGNKKRALYQLVWRDYRRYAERRDKAYYGRIDRVMEIIGRGTAEQMAAEQKLGERERRRKTEERANELMKKLSEKNIKIEGVGPKRAARKWEYGGDFKLEEVNTVFENPLTIEVSLADLMFMAVALDNKFARAHILYGNLWHKDEQAYWEQFLTPKGTLPKDIKDIVDAIGLEKEKLLRKAIDQYLFEDDGKGGRKANKQLMQITDAIRNDFEAHFPETKAVYEDMFNFVVEGQEHYLPIMITEGRNDIAEKQDEIEALTTGSYQVKISPDRGMNMVRIEIGPTHQTKIETDIFKVFFKGVEREEHFAKFAPYVRDLNTVLRGRSNNSKQLAANLTEMYGKWAVDRLYQHINMVGLPPSAKLNNAWENAAGLGRALSGNTGVAYIAYNIPAWLAQYPQSIAGFFGKADMRFIFSSLLEIMKPGNDLVDRVWEKSAMVRKRVINIAEEYRKNLEKEGGKFKELQAKFIEIGMMGQKHADKTMVAAGWWALYQTALKKGMSEEKAVVWADEITAETQPDLSAIETSPIYKDGGLGQLFIRFTQPLNVVWQNLTYDNFISREKSFAAVIARVTAYGIAALIVASARGALAKKDGEDKDPDELTRQVFYHLLFSSFFESVPIFGNTASGVAEKLLTGEGKIYQPRYFDFAERLFNIPVKMTNEDYEGAIKDAINALGLGAGLPTSQVNRIIKAIKEQNPWIILGYDP